VINKKSLPQGHPSLLKAQDLINLKGFIQGLISFSCDLPLPKLYYEVPLLAP